MPCPATSSGLKTADAQITTMPGKVRHVQLLADGTNAATVVVYDSENSTTSGKTVLAKLSIPAGGTADELVLDNGIVANRGIYADVTGTGAEYIVYFDLG